MKFYSFYTLYVCNEVNLILLCKESISESTMEKDKFTYKEIIDRIESDWKIETLKIVDNQIILTGGHNTRFIHTRVIENRAETDYSILYVGQINEFVKKINGMNNIGSLKDEFGCQFRIFKNEQSEKVHELVLEYATDESYESLKKHIIQDNNYNFIPYVFWYRTNEVDPKDVTVKRMSGTLSVNPNYKL